MNADNLSRPALNLQLFGEEPTETPQAPVEPVQPEPQPAQETEPQYENLGDFLKQYDVPGETEELEVEPQEPTELPPGEKTQEEQLILGKFKTQEDLVNAYQEAERRISEYGQNSSRAKQELEQLRNQVLQLQYFVQQQSKKPEATEEEKQERNQELLDRFYENPMEVLNEVVQSRVQQIVEPIQRNQQLHQYQQQYTQQVQQARQKYPDFDNLQGEMQKIVQEQGQYLAGLPNAVETIYQIAKAKTTTPSNPDQLLQDQSIRQKILQDESIRNEILKHYAQGVKAKQPPVVVGRQHGEVPAAPPQEIKSTKDAKKASLSFFQRLSGGGTS